MLCDLHQHQCQYIVQTLHNLVRLKIHRTLRWPKLINLKDLHKWQTQKQKKIFWGPSKHPPFLARPNSSRYFFISFFFKFKTASPSRIDVYAENYYDWNNTGSLKCVSLLSKQCCCCMPNKCSGYYFFVAWAIILSLIFPNHPTRPFPPESILEPSRSREILHGIINAPERLHLW